MTATDRELKLWYAEHSRRFQHEGSSVVRWLTGGSGPDAYVTFARQEDRILACCPHCKEQIGWFDYGNQTYSQIVCIRDNYARHRCQEKRDEG
jgi:hypothetical protein